VTEAEALRVAADAVQLAREAGADAAEAIFSIARRFHVEARAKTVSKLEHSTGKSLSMRIFRGGRRVSFATSELTRQALRDALARAAEQTEFVAADEFARLPDECGSYQGDLMLCDDSLGERADEAKIDEALSLEQMIRDADARVVNSSGSHYDDTIATVALANSAGFGGVYTSTRVARSSLPVAEQGGVKRTAHYGTAGRFLRSLESPHTVASVAARRAVEMFGARKPPTGRTAVIFERDIAAAVLHDLFAAVSAANVAVANSWLADREGERIGSELVTVIDDGTMAECLGSSPFDGEGTPTRRTLVFERGVLRSLLYDSYYARRLGARTTGNSAGGGIGANNFYLEPGERTLDELIASTERGVLVLDTIGFAHEHATGTYSRGARGFMIEHGELAYPVDEFTVAGSFPEMLAGLDGKANDLRFDGSIVSPSFRVAEMTVSGN
jgi:PmbA protein